MITVSAAVQAFESLGFEVHEAPGLSRPDGSAETVYWVRGPKEIGEEAECAVFAPHELTMLAEGLCSADGGL